MSVTGLLLERRVAGKPAIRPVGMVYPSGTFDYDYDVVGRLTELTNLFSETTTWAYYNGMLTNRSLDNGATAAYL